MTNELKRALDAIAVSPELNRSETIPKSRLEELVRRLRTDAGYSASRLGATTRIIGADCDEAADTIEALSAKVAVEEGKNQILARKYEEWFARAETAERDLSALKAERDGLERNRDMWKGQCERQSADLTQIRAALALAHKERQ